jgi:hypothetical protein
VAALDRRKAYIRLRGKTIWSADNNALPTSNYNDVTRRMTYTHGDAEIAGKNIRFLLGHRRGGSVHSLIGN